MFSCLITPNARRKATALTAWRNVLPDGGLTVGQAEQGDQWTAVCLEPPSNRAGFVQARVVRHGDQIVLFDGCLTNRGALAQRLTLADRKSYDDAELFAAAMSHRGITMPNAAYGDYAAVVHDPSSRQTWACTDHCAHRQLYFGQTREGDLVLATYLPLLVATPGFDRTLDGRALGQLLLALLPRGRTAFRNTHYLPPGHAMCWQPGSSPRLNRWWNPALSTTGRRDDPRAIADATAQLFDEAVAARIPAEGEVATTLSGGLDSTLVTGFAAHQLKQAGRPLQAYTSVPHPDLTPERRANWDASDWTHAAQLAERYDNIRHRAVHAGTPCPIDWMQSVHETYATPVRNTANSQWLLAANADAASRGCRVMLTGLRGNFGISQSRRQDALLLLFVTRQWHRLVSEIQFGETHPARKAASLMLHSLVGHRREIRRTSNNFRSYTPVPRSAISPWLLTAREDMIRPLDFSGDRGRFRALQLSASFAIDPRGTHGIGLADPTADRRLLEHILRIPPTAFVWHGYDRALARLMGKAVVPDAIRWRTTRGEQSPEIAGYFALHETRYREAWRSVAGTAVSQWFDKDVLVALLERLISGQGTREQAVFMHRVLDVGLFIRHVESRWGPQEISLESPDEELIEENMSA